MRVPPTPQGLFDKTVNVISSLCACNGNKRITCFTRIELICRKYSFGNLYLQEKTMKYMKKKHQKVQIKMFD